MPEENKGEANRRIRDFKQNPNPDGVLDLSGLGLTALPPGVHLLSGLRTLNLKDNDFATLPGRIRKATFLESLNLRDNQLETLPPEIEFLSRLRTLNLRGNKLTKLPTKVKNLASLERLNLQDNKLSALPPEIGQLASLLTLNLSENALEVLPPELPNLKSLKELCIASNDFVGMPREICQLKFLTKLDISWNDLDCLPSDIQLLSGLKTLRLLGCDLESLPPELRCLKSLITLHLYSNQLTSLPAEIGHLTNLRTLNLNSNQLTALPQEIGHLVNLRNLDLGNNQLSDLPREIQNLTELTVLELWNNPLGALLPEIKCFKKLTRLGLGRIKLAVLPPEIKYLTNLTSLELHENELAELPAEVEGLTNLESLRLDRNALEVLPAEIGKLSRLTTLVLSENKLSSLPREFKHLAYLRALQLWNNELTTLPPEIGKLTRLTKLQVSSNRLKSLPPEIKHLTRLTTLQIWSNQLTSLPPEIGHLIDLTTLQASRNQLTSLPPEVRHLTALETLDLRNNQLCLLPPEIQELTSLKTLNLGANQLAVLPIQMKQLSSLTALFLHNNPALGLPLETLGPDEEHLKVNVAPRPPQELLAYYFSLQGQLSSGPNGEPLMEGRVIVIGDGGAGKTSLVRALLHGKGTRKADTTTYDVVVEDWPDFKLVEPGTQKKRPVSIHVWDFGGQEPLHAAHPYFFTNRTLYLIVATSREFGVDDRISYWLNMVATYGRGARALVAVNKCDLHHMDIKQRHLCAKHSDCLPLNSSESFFATSCRRGESGWKGIGSLKKAIQRELQSMDQIWTLIPARWMTVKRQVENWREHTATLSFTEWNELCMQADIPEESRGELLELLSNLGIVLSFPADSHLFHYGILSPSWVTGGIYPLLTSGELVRSNGLLNRKELGKLLKDESVYPREKHGWLIDLMKKFDLLFENDGHLLLPSRLPKDTPEWAISADWSAKDVLQLELRFNVLPDSVISKFIARWHKRAWRPGNWWRYGIAVKDQNSECVALVRSDNGNPCRIALSVTPDKDVKMARQLFISVLQEELLSLAENLRGELWILLGGVFPIKYKHLLLRVHKFKQKHISEFIADEIQYFDLNVALDTVESPSQHHQSVRIVNILGNATGNVFGSSNEVSINSSL